MAQHPNARLTPAGRRILAERIAAATPVAHVEIDAAEREDLVDAGPVALRDPRADRIVP